MAQYIDKSALVAEIEKLDQLNIFLTPTDKYNEDYKCGYDNALEKVQDFINTLEVKEMDLDALGVLANHLIACNAHGITPKYSDRELDFLEGLTNNKVQKGE